MAKIKIPIPGTVGKSVRVDPDANEGATIGRDLRLPDGSVPTLAALAAALVGAATIAPQANAVSNTLWNLIREVPENVQQVQALSTAGLVTRLADGAWVTRQLEVSGGSLLTLDEPLGAAGNPTLGLDFTADVTWEGGHRFDEPPTIWDGTAYQGVVLDTRQVSAGAGLAGGGALTNDVTLSLSHLGLEDLTDPSADRIAFWDDSAGEFAWLEVGTGLNLTGTVLTATGGGGAWGDITGTLADQTDLQNALDAKADTTALLGLDGLSDPEADRALFWDESAGSLAWLTIGSGLQIVGTTISATGGGGGDAAWGSITGTLSDQTDLQNALDAKLEADITTPATGQTLYYDGTDWVNTQRLTITGYGISFRDQTGADPRLFMQDDSGVDVVGLYHISSTTWLRSYSDGHDIRLGGSDEGGTFRTLAIFDPDNAATFYYAGGRRLETTASGISVDGSESAVVVTRSGIGAEGRFGLASDSSLAIHNNNPGGIVLLRGVTSGSANANLLFADPDGSVTLNYAGSSVLHTHANGATIKGGTPFLQLENSDGTLAARLTSSSVLVLRNFQGGSNLHIQVTTTGGAPQNVFVGRPSGDAKLYHNNVEQFRTTLHSSSGKVCGAEVRDASSNFRPVGFLDMERVVFSSNQNVATAHWGKLLHHSSTTASNLGLSNTSAVPNGAMLTILNAFNTGVQGNVNVTQLSGVTLVWADGGTLAKTGNRTIATGGVATIWKMADNQYYIWGSGIS